MASQMPENFYVVREYLRYIHDLILISVKQGPGALSSSALESHEQLLETKLFQ